MITENEIVEVLKDYISTSIDNHEITHYYGFKAAAKTIMDKIKEKGNSFEDKYCNVLIPCPFCEYGVPGMPIPESLKEQKRSHDLYHKKG